MATSDKMTAETAADSTRSASDSGHTVVVPDDAPTDQPDEADKSKEPEGSFGDYIVGIPYISSKNNANR